jgi:RNA polymerase sigma factor (sigma-70 family)
MLLNRESSARSEQPLDGSMQAQVEAHRGLVRRWAWRYGKFGVPYEDLVAAGQYGLVEAAVRFDEKRGATFGTYALWWVRKSMIEALHDSTGNVVGTHFRRERRARLERVREGLATKLGSEPQVEDLARATGWRVQTVERSLLPMSRLVPLDSVSEGKAPSDMARFATPEDESPLQRMILRDGVRRLAEALSVLPAREMEVLLLRYGFSGEPPESLRRISQRLGVSSERVRQLERSAIGKLRRRMSGPPGSTSGRIRLSSRRMSP